MQKNIWLAIVGIIIAVGCLKVAAEDAKKAAAPAAAAADDKNGPDVIVLDKTAKMPAVKFPHAVHQKKFTCKECHEGDKPLFAKKHDAGLKMADMYKGEACGACHDGKKMVDGKAVFKAQTSCMKCHKKEEAAK